MSLGTDARKEFLLKMYETYNNELARQFGLAWQAIAIFAVSLIAIATSRTTLASIAPWVVLALYLPLVTWTLEVILDASFSYNRNLVVITNIEKEFFAHDDAKKIHYYFLSHRAQNTPIAFMRSLLLFVITIAPIVVAIYFILPWTSYDLYFYRTWYNYIPLIILAFCIHRVRSFATQKNRQYDEFKAQSPGIARGEPDLPATAQYEIVARPDVPWLDRATLWLENALLSSLRIETRK